MLLCVVVSCCCRVLVLLICVVVSLFVGDTAVVCGLLFGVV